MSTNNLSRWTIFIFGLLAFLLGLIGLRKPKLLLKSMGFEAAEPEERASHDYTPVFLLASSMASVNMGIYYMLTAVTNIRQFFVWTVPFRLVTFSVFTAAVLRGYAPVRFIGVALWELVGALATGWALRREDSE